MAAYLIADIDVKDAVGFEEYRKLVPASIERYGGRYLVRGGAFEKLEGNWEPKRLVVLQFESKEQAKQWYGSEEYRGAKELRFAAAVTNLILVEGV